jgi:hypothetical protein
LIQERVGNTLELVGIGKNFLNRTPAAQQLRDSIDKWDLIKLKSFCSSLAIKEMQIKTTLRFHLTSVRIAIIRNNRCWRVCGGEKGTLLHCWWECKLVGGYLKS